MDEYGNEVVQVTRYGQILSFLQRYSEAAFYLCVCFFVPFLIGHPQWLVGILVNAALVLSALNLRRWLLLPVIMLPSIAVLSRGLVFGPFTQFLIYMIPCIWLGNAIYVYCFKRLRVEEKMNAFTVLVIGSAAKASVLFVAALLLHSFGLLPVLFLSSMGLFQLWTALAGGTLALGIQSARERIVRG
jgi:hypothetical protein